MNVWIYVDTSKQVGDKDHLKVSPMGMPPRLGFGSMIRRAWPSNTRWKELNPPRPGLEARQREPAGH